MMANSRANYTSVIPNGKSRDDKPSMVDLYHSVTHQYAAQWEQLGLMLGLPYYHIAIISADHRVDPNRPVVCCRVMLQEWLKMNPACTWGKLDDVIKTLALPDYAAEDLHYFVDDYSDIIPNGKSRDDRPSMVDLYSGVIYQYAAQWEQVGLVLGLPDYDIANISQGNSYLQAGRSVECCRTVLEKWLQLAPSPTWGKLEDAIKLLTVAVLPNLHKESNHLKTYYKATRFTTFREDRWLPDQPKHFTPIVMILQQEQQFDKEVIMTVATINGDGTEEYLSTTSIITTKDLKEIFSQSEQQSDRQHQYSILIEGSPGIGKSVLLKHIAYLWANGELFTNTDFLFLLDLGDPSVQEIRSLDTIVNLFYHHDKQAHSKVASHIYLTGGKSITILLDSYDEMPRQNNFITDLIHRLILPKCSIVVSSRLHVSSQLRRSLSCRVEILGFSEEEQQHFIENSLEGRQDKVSELKQYLKHHPGICKLCSTPFNMAILLYLYKNDPLPTNSTVFYDLLIRFTICRHLTKSGITQYINDLNSLPQPHGDIMSQLSKFAFKSLCCNKLVFTEDEAKKECPDIHKNINGFGLLQVVEYCCNNYKSLTFNFIHLSIQEFLAAHHITTLPPNKELSILQKDFWNNPLCFNMFNMYVSLTNGQRPSFKQFIKQPTLMQTLKNVFVSDLVGIPQQILDDKIKCLRLYCCLEEAGDMEMVICIKYGTKLYKKIVTLSYTVLSPNDLEILAISLSFLSRKIEKWKMINLEFCSIHDHGLQNFQSALRRADVSIATLCLNNNDLTASSSAHISDLSIDCKVKTLLINDNKTVGENVKLYRILTDPSSMVEELYMHNINLSSSAAVKLFTALGEAIVKLRILWISYNDITDEACDTIVVAMKKNNTLFELNMDHNPISGICAQLIVKALQHNDTLQWLDINGDYPHDVKENIRSLEEGVNKMREIQGCPVKLRVIFL